MKSNLRGLKLVVQKIKLHSNSSINNSFKINPQKCMLHYFYSTSAQDCSLQEREVSNGCTVMTVGLRTPGTFLVTHINLQIVI